MMYMLAEVADKVESVPMRAMSALIVGVIAACVGLVARRLWRSLMFTPMIIAIALVTGIEFLFRDGVLDRLMELEQPGYVWQCRAATVVGFVPGITLLWFLWKRTTREELAP